MKIVVFGAGGVGGFFGGKLANAGFDTTLIARGQHLKAIQKNGLSVKSINGDFHVNIKATDSYNVLIDADLLIFAVKSWQLDGISEEIKGILNPEAIILPLQNGADSAERLGNILNPAKVLGGLCKIVSKITGPGKIDHFAFAEPEIIFGELDGTISERVNKIKDTLEEAGIKNRASEDIRLDIWRKFLFIATVSGMGAITRATFGEMRENDAIRNLLYQTANEIVAVANARNIGLSNTDIEVSFSFIDNTIPQTTASMQRDIMEGKPSELDNFNGFIVRKGKELHVPTPINSFTYHCLLPQENRARSGS